MDKTLEKKPSEAGDYGQNAPSKGMALAKPAKLTATKATRDMGRSNHWSFRRMYQLEPKLTTVYQITTVPHGLTLPEITVTTFPGSQHHQNKNGEKFWVSLGPHGFPTQRTFKVGKSTTTLATFHDFKSFKGGRCSFWATKLHYCFPVKFSCLGGVQKTIQCSGIWRKTA